MYCKLIHTEDFEGFTIRGYACEEDLNPADHFEDEEVIEGIRSGRYDWFCAKVTASKNGIKLADDYLGGCCYESVREFFNEVDGYYHDMRAVVVEAAKAAIKELAEAA